MSTLRALESETATRNCTVEALLRSENRAAQAGPHGQFCQNVSVSPLINSYRSDWFDGHRVARWLSLRHR